MKKSFVILFLFLFVGIAHSEQKRIEVEGTGLPVSKNAPIEIRKQEAQYPVVDSRGMDFPLVIIK